MVAPLGFDLPKSRGETSFQDFKKPLDAHEAHLESNRCINCFDAPCTRACPTEIDIPKFIRRIAAGQVEGAARTILESNIFGHSCAVACPVEVLCEGACVYHSLDKKPISIGKLQRFAIEATGDQARRAFFRPGDLTLAESSPSASAAPPQARDPRYAKPVALAGAGPASLACAHELRRLGHETVVFEKSRFAGGLNTTGIAPYKMRAETSSREIEHVVGPMGIEVRYAQTLGKNLSWDELADPARYSAVFLGLGLGPDTMPAVPGVHLPHPRIWGAVQWIEKLKTEPESALAETWGRGPRRTALVIGGGNTALDACRELKALGFDRVLVSYRRGQAEMSGYAHEWKCAAQEGVEFAFHTAPRAFAPATKAQGTPAGGDEGPVSVTLAKTRVQDGRVSLTAEDFCTGAAFDVVLFATGQATLESQFSKMAPSLRWKNGHLDVDPETGATSLDRVYAGGDIVNGGKEVVNAVAEGKRAAHAIHRRLSKNG